MKNLSEILGKDYFLNNQKDSDYLVVLMGR